MITETTPPPVSPVPYSPARSVPSVDAPPPCSPTEPPSPEYTAVPTTTGETKSRALHVGFITPAPLVETVL